MADILRRVGPAMAAILCSENFIYIQDPPMYCKEIEWRLGFYSQLFISQQT